MEDSKSEITVDELPNEILMAIAAELSEDTSLRLSDPEYDTLDWASDVLLLQVIVQTLDIRGCDYEVPKFTINEVGSPDAKEEGGGWGRVLRVWGAIQADTRKE